MTMTTRTSRRRFLRDAGMVMTSTTLGGSLLRVGAASAASASEYRALVCVLLAGGNDSFNMLVPNDDVGYANYAAVRSDLALPRSSLLALAGRDAIGQPLAVHPSMPEVRALHDAGELAFVANLGTLVGPLDASEFERGVPVPLGLFSHSDQIAHWQTGVPDARIATGWGGRAADLLGGLNARSGVSMNVSLSGSNVFQAGLQTAEYAIETGAEGAPSVAGYGASDPFDGLQTRALDRILSGDYDNLLRAGYAQKLRGAIDAEARFSTALAGAPSLMTSFSANRVSAAFAQIARVIGARDALGARRQTFFLVFGGWDHHDEVIENQARMLAVVSKGLAEFSTALKELGVHQQVTTFTTSDFGRTLTSNGRGSDHGWGGHHMVMGGAVRGGRTYGAYPDLSASSPLAIERSIIIPTLSTDAYFAELSRWFGVGDGDLPTVLPNVRRFVASGTPNPIGFLAPS